MFEPFKPFSVTEMNTLLKAFMTELIKIVGSDGPKYGLAMSAETEDGDTSFQVAASKARLNVEARACLKSGDTLDPNLGVAAYLSGHYKLDGWEVTAYIRYTEDSLGNVLPHPVLKARFKGIALQVMEKILNDVQV
jgi:hypothetical protein